MAASTVNRSGSYRPSGGRLRRLKMAAESIPAFVMVMINAAGFVANATDSVGTHFLGITTEAIDNSAGSAGDLLIEVDVGGAEIKCAHEDGGLTIADVGATVVQELNNEVTSAATGTNDVTVGKISEVINAAEVWVDCKPYGVLT